MDNDMFETSRRMMTELLELSRGVLGQESIAAVRHYLDHDEYEMAFEGAFIDLMACAGPVPSIDIEAYQALGRDLGLDRESVFDADFWVKFQDFVERQMGTRG